MAKTLLIVESPAKAKTIKKYVGDGYEVLASKGHIKDLPKRGGVDIDNGFQETYELLEEKGKPEVQVDLHRRATGIARRVAAPGVVAALRVVAAAARVGGGDVGPLDRAVGAR